MQEKNKTTIITISAVVVLLIIGFFIQHNKKDIESVDEMVATTTNATTSQTTTTVKSTANTTSKPAAVATPTTALPAQFVMMVGNSYTLPEGSTITLKDVSDSRCPTDENIKCVWAGNVTAKLNIKKGSYTKDIELSIPGASYTHSGYKITLDSVTPDRGLQSVVNKKEDYKLTFTVAK